MRAATGERPVMNVAREGRTGARRRILLVERDIPSLAKRSRFGFLIGLVPIASQMGTDWSSTRMNQRMLGRETVVAAWVTVMAGQPGLARTNMSGWVS